MRVFQEASSQSNEGKRVDLWLVEKIDSSWSSGLTKVCSN